MRSFVFAIAILFGACAASAQGPVLLAGIDTEWGRRPGNTTHGTIATWAAVINQAILANVTNGNSGILVIGGGKNGGDDVTDFWTQVAGALGQPVVFVNGNSIAVFPFDSFAMIAVATSSFASGALVQTELDRLNVRQPDVTAFLCNGGGLFASSDNLPNAYQYLASVFPITAAGSTYSDVTPTTLGSAMGVTNTNLDTGPWHTVFTSFPGFLQVLATVTGSSVPAMIGSTSVAAVVADFSLAKTRFCLGEPILADTSGTFGARDHFWSIQESDPFWNRYGPELMRWMGGPARPIDLAALARQENLPLQCDRYYRVKLAVNGLCRPWVETTQLIYVSCSRVDAGPDQCCNDDLRLGNAKDDGNVAWQWSPATDLDDPSARNPRLQLKASFTEPKTYTVTGTNAMGCTSTDTTTIYCGPPKVQIDVAKSCCNATLTARGTPVATRRWSNGSNTESVVVSEPGLHAVEVATPCGKASAAAKLIGDDFLRGPFPTLIARASFSPAKEVFRIYHLGFDAGHVPSYNATGYELRIYDRWGGEHLVAQTNPGDCGRFPNGTIAWDGRINGQLVQQGAYLWRLTLRNCDGTAISRQTVRKRAWECTRRRCFLWFCGGCAEWTARDYDELAEAHAVTVVY